MTLVRLNQSMAFFRTINFSEPLPSIEGDGIMLRTPQMDDFEEWAALRDTSRDFLTPWEPTWPVDDLTRAAFRRRIKRYAEDLRSDQGYAFLIARNSDGAESLRPAVSATGPVSRSYARAT